MSITRYNVLDDCFRDFSMLYTKEDLLKSVNNRLRNKGLQEIRTRSLESDIANMEKLYDIELDEIKVGRKKAYRYLDKDFSINSKKLNKKEAIELKHTIEFLKRLGGLPNCHWVEELSVKLGEEIEQVENSKNFISFQNNEYLKGYQSFFTKLYHHILNKRVLRLTYQKFAQNNNDSQVSIHTFHPQYLKQFNNRWYLFGWNESFNDISNFPIDRIENIEEVDGDYNEGEIDWENYFENIIGVTIPKKDDNIKTVLLEVKNTLYPYIRTKPLHESQTKKNDLSNEITTIIELKLIINYELESLLLSFGSGVKVLEPIELVESIKKKVEDNLENYL